MFDTKRIRTPWKQRWRRFRYSVLPLISFGACIALMLWMWGRQVQLTNSVGEVERRRFDVTSGANGKLAKLDERPWTLFDKVHADDVVAQLDPKPVKAALATAGAEINRLKKEVDAAQAQFMLARDEQQIGYDYDYAREKLQLTIQVERHQLDILDRQTVIATDQADLQRLDVRLKYLQSAAGAGVRVVAEQTLKEAQEERRVVEQRIQMNQKALAEAKRLKQVAETRLQKYGPIKSPEAAATLTRILAPLQAAIETQQARIRELQIQIDSLVIRAPVTGTIAAIYRWPGQNVQVGDPILTIAADEGGYIVGYIRQDQGFRPRVGTVVEVRSRVPGGPPCNAKVTQVGPQFEPAPTELLRDRRRPEWVLPVRISFPAELDARPGETLDLFFKLGANDRPKP